MSKNIATEVYEHGSELVKTAAEDYAAANLILPTYGRYEFCDDQISEWTVGIRPDFRGAYPEMAPLHRAPNMLTKLVLGATGLSSIDANYARDRLEVRHSTLLQEAERIDVERSRKSGGLLNGMVAGHLMRHTDFEGTNSIVGALTPDSLRRGQSLQEVASSAAKLAVEQFLEVKPEHLRLEGRKTVESAESDFRELHGAFARLVSAKGETLDTQDSGMFSTGYHFDLGNRYQAVLSGTAQEVGMAISSMDDQPQLPLYILTPAKVSLAAYARRTGGPEGAKVVAGLIAQRHIRLESGVSWPRQLDAKEKEFLTDLFRQLCNAPEAAIVDKPLGSAEEALMFSEVYHHEREIARLMQPKVPVDLSPLGLE